MADVAAPPHPRDAFALEGAQAQEQAFLDALERGRLHHAWLLTGPEGVGKATFAFRAARRLLGAAPDPNPDDRPGRAPGLRALAPRPAGA
jgi:DNA polymerase-3 subunit delta'